MVEVNCLTHREPHERGGRCRVWVAAYDEAYRRAGLGDLGRYYEHLPKDFTDCRWADDRWAEPHRGVAGVERDDDLLDLSDRAVARRKLMLVTVRALHDALLVGNPAPRVKRMYDRFGRDNAQVGDLVAEVTTLHDHEMRGFGILVEHREEWASTAAEWQKVIEDERVAWEEGSYEGPFDPDGEDYIRQTDHAWYVQYGPRPGDLCRWTNCSFVAVPTSADQLDERMLGEPIEGGGVRLTRGDLVGGLSDAGFQLTPRSGK
jgi:hypothetical protein